MEELERHRAQERDREPRVAAAEGEEDFRRAAEVHCA